MSHKRFEKKTLVEWYSKKEDSNGHQSSVYKTVLRNKAMHLRKTGLVLPCVVSHKISYWFYAAFVERKPWAKEASCSDSAGNGQVQGQDQGSDLDSRELFHFLICRHLPTILTVVSGKWFLRESSATLE